MASSAVVEALRAIEDPAERVAAAAQAMDDARAAMAQIAAIRHAAVRQLKDELGATGAARRLGISRSNVYRMLGEEADVT